MRNRKTRQRGHEVEQLARNHLEARGLKTLARNYHCRWGELDLVMEHDDQLVFVEVRYRHDSKFGGAAASVTMTKQEKLHRAAARFLEERRLGHRPVRFDIVAVEGDELRIDWVVDAFRPNS